MLVARLVGRASGLHARAGARHLGGQLPLFRSSDVAAPSSTPLAGFLTRRCVSVRSEATPNPDSMMFHPDARDVLGPGLKTKKFSNKYDTNDSSLAAALFKVKGVHEVLLASKHVTVTKTSAADWDVIQPSIELVMNQFFSAGLKVIRPGAAEPEDSDVEAGSIEEQILDILEERVRPFVQQDGGDVSFDRFDKDAGALYLRMHGACSGCPKSNITLQVGIKNLMQHYVPEVKEVLAVGEEDEEEIPRPHKY